MKVLVLGGNGFIGSHVVDRLLAGGDSVRVFDRYPERFREPRRDVDYRLSDFDDISALAEAIEGVDVVYHLISTTVPSTSNKNPVYDIETNLVGSLRLLELLRDSSVSRLVYLSSGGTVYGVPESLPVNELHPLRPVCSYGVIKVAIESYLQMFHHLYGLDYVCLRASNPYGERQGHAGVQGVVGTFLSQVLANEPINVWGDGSVVKDFFYVGDLADLCVLAGRSNKVGVVNAGSGTGTSIKDIVCVLEEVVERDVSVRYLDGREYDIPKIVLDIERARQWYGWNPQVSLVEGIRRSWGWMKSVRR